MFTAGTSTREGAAGTQDPSTPRRVSVKHSERPGEGGSRRLCDPLVQDSLVDGEVTGRCHRGCHYPSLGPSRSRGCHPRGHQVVNSFHLVGGFHVCETTQEVYI